MEYHITMGSVPMALGDIDDALRVIDPAALLDLHAGILRISTTLRAGELAAVLGNAGHPLEDGQLTQVPSICCGGCSG
jgi:hypothetical protein